MPDAPIGHSMNEGLGLAVIALGGNAILRPGEEATFAVQMRHLHATMRRVVSVMERFSGIVITHGNGPQVGDILLQNEMARGKVPPMPLDVCVAQSQGQIGYMVQLALMNEMRRAGIEADVICALTAVTIGPRTITTDEPSNPSGHIIRNRRRWRYRRRGVGRWSRTLPEGAIAGSSHPLPPWRFWASDLWVNWSGSRGDGPSS